MRRQRDIFLFSSAAPTVTLFGEHGDPSRRPASLLASAAVHALVIGVVAFGILYAPARPRVVTDRYTVRRLDLHATPEEMRRAARGQPNAAARQVAAALAPPSAPAAAPLRQTVEAPVGPQTLLQPDLATKLAEAEAIPVPQILIWTPRKTLVKVIVAPQPAPPTTAEARPSAEAPNQEINLADVNIAAGKLPTEKIAILPSTTTPIVAKTASPVQLPPSTVSQPTAEPTPTAVLSLSDLRLKDGTATLPPVNESARTSAAGTLTGTTGKDAGSAGAGSAGSNPTSVKQPGNPTPAPTAAQATGQPDGSPTGPAQGANAGNGQADPTTATEITLPRDGRFGSVIVGESVEDQFPEMANVWSGRLAYTVYLHVGLARSWILQYSLPSSADAAANGSVDRLDAPWPYAIVRPNLAANAIDADALMVHGFVNQAGRFENLVMVFPQACPQAPFVLKSLQQWQFRPAAQDGHAARVEVLLIIPEELE